MEAVQRYGWKDVKSIAQVISSLSSPPVAHVGWRTCFACSDQHVSITAWRADCLHESFLFFYKSLQHFNNAQSAQSISSFTITKFSYFLAVRL